MALWVRCFEVVVVVFSVVCLMRSVKFAFVTMLALLITACSTIPGGEVYISEADKKASAQTPSITLEQIEFKKITAQNVGTITIKKRIARRNPKLEAKVKNYSYTIGPGDVLNVTVWEHPELLNLGSQDAKIIVNGFLVDAEGYIFYPYVGRFYVKGKTINEVRSSLSEALAKYVKNPQLSVVISKFLSKKVYLTGQIARPLPQVLTDQATTLLDAINNAGGVNSNADLDDVVVVRKGRRVHIDYYAMMHFGDMRENVLLKAGDQIHVARKKTKLAYLMGQVTAPTAIPISNEIVTLAEALGRALGINELSADASAVYIIRKSKQKGKVAKVFMLDLSNMAAMVLASRFEIKPEDVVYVSKAPIVKWNQFMSVVSPSLSGIRDLITTQAAISGALK